MCSIHCRSQTLFLGERHGFLLLERALHHHLVLPPVSVPLSSCPAQALDVLRRAEREGRTEHPWSSRGWGWHLGSTFLFSSSPYPECSPWLRTVGRKKNLKGEKTTSEAKEENKTEARGQTGGRSLPACLLRDQEPGKCLCGTLCGPARVLVGKAVEWVWGVWR